MTHLCSRIPHFARTTLNLVCLGSAYYSHTDIWPFSFSSILSSASFPARTCSYFRFQGLFLGDGFALQIFQVVNQCSRIKRPPASLGYVHRPCLCSLFFCLTVLCPPFPQVGHHRPGLSAPGADSPRSPEQGRTYDTVGRRLAPCPWPRSSNPPIPARLAHATTSRRLLLPVLLGARSSDGHGHAFPSRSLHQGVERRGAVLV